MESIIDLKQKIMNFKYLPNVTQCVEVTYIKDPGNFYVRPYDYNQYMSVIESRMFWEDSRGIQIQSMVIYLSETLKHHVRGQIFYSDNNDGEMVYDIYALDYGCLDKNVPLKNISKPSHDTESIPALAQRCELANCHPLGGKTWSDTAIDAMKFYVGKGPIKIILKQVLSDLLSVELDSGCPDDVATLMALTDYSTFGYSNNLVNRFQLPEPEKHYIEFKKLSVGDVLHVRVQWITNWENMYVAEPKDYKNYLEQKENFTFFSHQLKELPLEDFKVNTPVGVFMIDQSKYERGVVKEIMDSRAKIQLIDLGKVVEVHRSVLKPMCKKFFFYPATAIYCSLVGWDDKVPRILQPSCEILITIKQVGFKFDQPNLVTASAVSKSTRSN